MKELEERYLKEIEKPSLAETVDEHFDSITTMLTPNAVLYGSTITSMIAGLPIEGDLDIAVSHLEFMSVAKNLANSTKWLQTEGNRITEDDFSRKVSKSPLYNPPKTSERDSEAMPRGYVRTSFAEKPRPPKSYGGAPNLPISQVVAFKTVNNVRVHIMQSKGDSGDPLEDALTLVRSVDFVFCGIGMDKYGRLLEVIEGAYDDCCQRTIKVAQYSPLMKPSKLKQRFDKYIERGWSLGVDIDQAIGDLNKAREEYMLREAERTKKLKAKQAKQKSRRRKSAGKLYEIRDRSIVFQSNFLTVVPTGVLLEQVQYVSGRMDYHMEPNDRAPDFVMFTCDSKISGSTLASMAYKVCLRINAKYSINVAERVAANRREVSEQKRKDVYSAHGRYEPTKPSLGKYTQPYTNSADAEGLDPRKEVATEGTTPEEQKELIEEVPYQAARVDAPPIEEAKSPSTLSFAGPVEHSLWGEEPRGWTPSEPTTKDEEGEPTTKDEEGEEEQS